MKNENITPISRNPVDNNPKSNSIYTIPLELAVEWTTRWREAHGPTSVRSFRVDVAELLEIINERDCKYMRVYFGINDQKEEKLVLVGVDHDNLDILSQVYDFTQPCPSTCDNTSPLSCSSEVTAKKDANA